MNNIIASCNTVLEYLSLPDIHLPSKKTDIIIPSTPMVTSSWIRLAGLSGAAAVSLGAYGAHVLRDDATIDERRKKSFETGSRYHLIHSLALVAATKARYPLVSGTLIAGGIVLFCGPCYHYSLSGSESSRRFTPFGGVLLILGWLSFIL